MSTVTLKSARRRAKSEGWLGWIRTEGDERALLNGCYFDEEAATRAVNFFPTFLRHSKGEWGGKPFELMDWEAIDIIAPLFGWKRADGWRRFRTASIWVPKKTGKSTIGAGVGILCTCADGEAGAEVYSVATKRDQAAIVHDEAIHMVEASRSLDRRLHINRSTKTIYDQKTKSKYKALASDAKGSEGLNWNCLIVDELHAWPNDVFWNTLRYGCAVRKQPIRFIISTAGIYDKASLGWLQYDYAKRVAANLVHDEQMLVYIREADKDDDWTDPAVHKKANPSYGVLIDPEEMMECVKVAKEQPAEENPFKRYRLNIWTQALDAMIRADDWNRCGGALDLDDYIGRECWGGLDIGATSDFTSLCLVFPRVEAEGYDAFWWHWMPQERAELGEKQGRAEFVRWAREGWITLTPGNEIDYAKVRADINEIFGQWHCLDLAIDRLFQGAQLAQELKESDGWNVTPFGQGFASMTAPTPEVLRLIRTANLKHGDNPLVEWMAMNAVTQTNAAGGIKPDKENSREKIDGIVSLIMAVAMAMLVPEPPPTYYDDCDELESA